MKLVESAMLSNGCSEPATWRRTLLGEAGEIVSGVTLGRKLREGKTRRVPYLRVANVKDGYLELSDVYETEATETEIQKLRLRAGDLLLTEGGDADKLGRGTVWQEQLPLCIHQNHIFRVRFDPDCFSPDFVAAEISSPYGKAYFLRHAKQTTGIATINQKVLANFPLLVPPVTEQRRITAALAESLAVVDKARRASAERLVAAEALPAAYLREVFDGPEATGWETRGLAELLARPIRTGISKPTHPESKTYCLTLSAVRGRTLLLDACKPVAVSESEADGNWVQPGSFYVVRGNGNRALVGRGAFAPDPLSARVLFPDLLFELTLDPECIDRGFFGWLWSSPVIRREIETRARTAAGIYKINTGNLMTLRLPVPPIAEQRRMSGTVRACVERAEQLAHAAHGELNGIDALPAALLRQAFAGKLD